MVVGESAPSIPHVGLNIKNDDCDHWNGNVPEIDKDGMPDAPEEHAK